MLQTNLLSSYNEKKCNKTIYKNLCRFLCYLFLIIFIVAVFILILIVYQVQLDICSKNYNYSSSRKSICSVIIV